MRPANHKGFRGVRFLFFSRKERVSGVSGTWGGFSRIFTPREGWRAAGLGKWVAIGRDGFAGSPATPRREVCFFLGAMSSGCRSLGAWSSCWTSCPKRSSSAPWRRTGAGAVTSARCRRCGGRGVRARVVGVAAAGAGPQSGAAGGVRVRPAGPSGAAEADAGEGRGRTWQGAARRDRRGVVPAPGDGRDAADGVPRLRGGPGHTQASLPGGGLRPRLRGPRGKPARRRLEGRGYGRVVRIALAGADRRAFTPTPWGGPSWRRGYVRRGALEQINVRLDNSFGFERHFVRVRARMKARLGLALAVMMALALGSLAARHPERRRSLVDPGLPLAA